MFCGKRKAARNGYRYITKHEGDGEARYQVLKRREARVVRKNLRVVRTRALLDRRGLPSPAEGGHTHTKGQGALGTVLRFGSCLRTRPTRGAAAFGKTRATEPLKAQKRLRETRPPPEQPRRPAFTCVDTAIEKTRSSTFAVPPLDQRGAFRRGSKGSSKKTGGGGGPNATGTDTCYKGWSSASGAATAAMGKPTRPCLDQGEGAVCVLSLHRFRRGTPLPGQRAELEQVCEPDLLDAAVWEDVRSSLLSEPRRIRQEYERRQRKTKPDGKRAVDQLALPDQAGKEEHCSD